MRAYAPGLVLTLAEIEAACGLGLDRVELLGDATPWKLKFTSEVREQRYVHVHRRRPVPLARHAWHAALRPRMRTAYHRLLPGRARRG
jgi:CelD/BcsL family acetyltransferase involved in cellulose biosynthesis